MNIQKITALSLILVTNIFNVHAMELPHSDKTQEFVSAMQTSEFANFTQTPKFLALLQKPEFWAMMQTPQFQAFLKALQSYQQNRNLTSHRHIQEALENLLETEALEDLFKTGIFSDKICAKHNAMKETEAYAEYQGAKQYCIEGCLTQDIVNDCKEALRNTKEYNNLIDAANAEMFTPSLSNEEIAFINMQQTLQYQAYDQANKLHEKHNTLETKNLLEEALGLLLKTQESQLLLQIKDQKKLENENSQIYSDDVLAKNLAMEETPERKQYEEAKLAYEQNPNEDTRYMLDLCKAELRNTKECQAFLTATEQEQHITHNIVNSQKWETEQHISFQSIETILNKRHVAWTAVKNTEEYQRFQQAKLDHERYNNDDTLFLLNEHQRLAKETREYKEYDTINHELSTKTGESPKKNIYIIKPNPQTNSNSCILNNSNNDDNTTTASSTTQSQAIEIFSANVLDRYQAIKKTTLYKEYQGAKQLHQTDKTDDTHRIMCNSLAELILAQPWEKLVLAMRQEKRPLNNIIQSEKWVAEQTYSAFPHLKGRLPTKKSQDLQIKLVDFLCNKLEMQLSPNQQHARITNNNNNNFGITIQPYSSTHSDCCITHEGPKIDIPLTSPNNNYSPRETCVLHNLQLKLTNNNNNNNEK